MDWRYNTIWFEQLNQANFYQQDFKEGTKSDNKFAEAEYAILWRFKQEGLSFDSLNTSDKLLYLELNWSNIIDFQRIGIFKRLKRLELHYCTKLENDLGLSEVKDTLEFLHVNQSKKFTFGEDLLQLSNLKLLCLNSCAKIDNLDFLTCFPNLIDFRFVDTNIISGDLTPIIAHPKISTVGFLNKRHYNYTGEQMKAALSLKSHEEYKCYAHKGDFRTY